VHNVEIDNSISQLVTIHLLLSPKFRQDHLHITEEMDSPKAEEF
jgi:hypothetical protein